MDTKESLTKEIVVLYDEGEKLAKAFRSKSKEINFHFDYQSWYTKALRVVEVLAPDRYQEFRSYYEIDPKRKSLGYSTYVIQDYLKNVIPGGVGYANFDSRGKTLNNFFNQLTIFNSLIDRIEEKIANIETELLSEIQDAELVTAKNLMKFNIRAAGSLTGVIIESFLQKLAKKHKILSKKKNPTISDLNNHLKKAEIFDTPTWRKVSYLADIRNMCSHKKNTEPTKDQVIELIDGANWLTKNVF